MTARWAIILLLVSVVAGCTPAPFPEQNLPELTKPDPAAIRQEFAASLADRFVSDDTVLIQAPFHDELAVLGVLRVDRKAGTFELAALSHVGVSLFTLSGNRDTVKIVSAMPGLADRKVVLLSIAGDIRRMFFNLVPAPDDKSEIGSTKVRFFDDAKDLTYEFAGQPPILLEKRQDNWLGTNWRVRYYQYAADDTGYHPRGIVMDNSEFHYRIIVKNRQWQTH